MANGWRFGQLHTQPYATYLRPPTESSTQMTDTDDANDASSQLDSGLSFFDAASQDYQTDPTSDLPLHSPHSALYFPSSTEGNQYFPFHPQLQDADPTFELSQDSCPQQQLADHYDPLSPGGFDKDLESAARRGRTAAGAPIRDIAAAADGRNEEYTPGWGRDILQPLPPARQDRPVIYYSRNERVQESQEAGQMTFARSSEIDRGCEGGIEGSMIYQSMAHSVRQQGRRNVQSEGAIADMQSLSRNSYRPVVHQQEAPSQPLPSNVDDGSNARARGGMVASKSRELICQLCNIPFGRKSELRRHNKQQHSDVEPPFACPRNGCNERRWWKKDIERHLTTHGRTEEYVCGSCGKSFSRNDNRHRHEKKYHPA